MENSTSTHNHLPLTAAVAAAAPNSSGPSDGNAFLYILIVMSFYGFFLCAVMLGYFRSKRREKRRVNIFTKLVHDKEKQEWGALPNKKHCLPFPPSSSSASAAAATTSGLTLPFCSSCSHRGHPSPLACALCTEQSSVSSLCSSADTRVAIEEEDDGTAEEAGKSSGDDSG